MFNRPRHDNYYHVYDPRRIIGDVNYTINNHNFMIVSITVSLYSPWRNSQSAVDYVIFCSLLIKIIIIDKNLNDLDEFCNLPATGKSTDCILQSDIRIFVQRPRVLCNCSNRSCDL